MRAWWVLAALMVLTLSGCFGDRESELEPRFEPQGAPGVDVEDVRDRANRTLNPVCLAPPDDPGARGNDTDDAADENNTDGNGTNGNGTVGNGTNGNGTSGNGTEGEPKEGEKSEQAGQDPSGNGSNETDGNGTDNGMGSGTGNGTGNDTARASAMNRTSQVNVTFELDERQDCVAVTAADTNLTWSDMVITIEGRKPLRVAFNAGYTNMTRVPANGAFTGANGTIEQGDAFYLCAPDKAESGMRLVVYDDERLVLFEARFALVRACPANT